MTARKTVAVDKVLQWANQLLAAPASTLQLPPETTPEQAYRLGAAHLLEVILHDTSNYRGFGYTHLNFTGGIPNDETRRGYYRATH